MFGFSLKDRIMRRSIYLHSVMCVSPDAVKRHEDLSFSTGERWGGWDGESYGAVFFSVYFIYLFIFYPHPHIHFH